MRKLGSTIEPLIEPALLRQGFTINKMIANWAQIVGEISDWCTPVSISFPKNSRVGGTLKLNISSGRGPEALAITV